MSKYELRKKMKKKTSSLMGYLNGFPKYSQIVNQVFNLYSIDICNIFVLV